MEVTTDKLANFSSPQSVSGGVAYPPSKFANAVMNAVATVIDVIVTLWFKDRGFSKT